MPAASGSHVVHFYEDESSLARTVGQYLREAAQTGAVAIVIATDAHHRAFEAELARGGIDPAEARRNGALVGLDAATTLHSLMPAGQLDRDALRHMVSPIVRWADEAGRPVWGYGEMVALLWEAGNVVAAIELEEMWNELAREHEFSLLCGYRSCSVHADEHADALAQLCHLHTSVLDGSTLDDHDARAAGGVEGSADFPAQPDAPRAARHFVADLLGGHGYEDAFLSDAQLVVTELATNAVVHARSPFSVVARADESGARISVRDASQDRPTLGPDDPLALSGRGLRLVAALAVDWGVELTADGKSVWALLRP